MENVLGKVIEIEDYNGNTVMAFMIDDNGKIIQYKNCDIADETDDYIFDTDKKLLRIQVEEEII